MAKMTTAPWVGNLSGRLGNVVVVESPHGNLLRTPPERSQPKSSLQQTSESRMAAASRAFGTLTRAEGQAWAVFGASLAEPRPRTGRIVGLSAQQAFNRLANKLLQIDPQAALPKTPPSGPFFGDGVRITVGAGSPSQSGSSLRGGWGESQDGPLGGGGVVFTASAANAPGVLTELLLQPLASQHRRTYRERYRTQAFVAFGGTESSATVPCPKGWVAAAVRFVEATTGRTTALVEIGVVQVGGGAAA